MSFHQFRGQRTGTPKRRGGFSQASTRHQVTGYDQFGRAWSYPVENDSGAPCGIPMPQFVAPFMPDPEFVFVNPDNTSEVYVDNIAIARTRRAALRSYHAEAIQYASDNKLEAPKVGDYSAVIKEKCGRPPRAFQPFLACEQENPWALGRTKTPDPRLEQYVEHPSNSFEAEFGEFDFSEASYKDATGGKPTKAPVYKSFADARRAMSGSVDEIGDIILSGRDGEPTGEPDEYEQAFASSLAEATSEFTHLENAAAAAGESGEEGLTDFEDLRDEELTDGSIEGDGAEEQQQDELHALEDHHDAEALGGRTVRPDQTERVERQAPRHGNASARRKGNRGWDPSQHKGKTLADGARPAIGGE